MATPSDTTPDQTLTGSKHSNNAETRMSIIGGIAGVLMFLSWFAQTVGVDDLNGERSTAIDNFQFIQAENSQTLDWMIAFQNERRKAQPDPEILMNAAVNYADKMVRIIEASTKIDPQSKILGDHLYHFKKLRVPLDQAVSRRNIQALIETASSLMEYVHTIAPQAEEQMSLKLADLTSTQQNYKWMFRILFLSSSIASAYAWGVSYKYARKRVGV